MDAPRIAKWIVVVAVVVVAWKFGMPWVKEHTSRGNPAPAVTTDNACLPAAERASDVWGSGIGRFVNPPYDLDAWSSFRNDVDSKITAAESACSSSAESCLKARDALKDLRSLVSDLDTAIRNGSEPPSDLVQRQGTIDAQLDNARDLVRSGK